MRRLTKVLLKLARLGALLVAREPEWEVSFWHFSDVAFERRDV